MPSNNARDLEKSVVATLPSDHRPTEAEVRELTERLRAAFPVSDEEFQAILRALHAKLVITLEPGTAITKEDYRPWLILRKAGIETFYWERYRNFLVGEKRWPPLVVNALDRVGDDILDLAGDPERDGEWARKGLIVGDVQSGKTATYTGLCCKAADAGYRLIILLTGTIESLRRQTQERLDAGFVGRDSFEMLQANRLANNLAIGVGLLDGRRFAAVLTSRSRDFSTNAARQFSLSVRNSGEPILLVCKKNPKILMNLRTWLQTYNADNAGKIEIPLLLIDDEADNASINTRERADEATRTNREIRMLLQLFKRSAYIGVTATPFANVFINPDNEDATEDARIGGDLFPSDFIYSLESPNNYVGPQAIFDEDGGTFLKHFDDAEAFIPASHKIDHTVRELPPSLIDAIRSFVLTTTIRDLRGEGPTHRSMLINVSRFTRVQDEVAGLVDAELRELQREIRLYASLSADEACGESLRLADLRRFWMSDYDTNEVDWNAIQGSLHASVQPIVVRSVNQRAGAASVDYKMHKDGGLRVIAVGGNSLSRGLTLEGLSTSYFYRNSHMYDTLLQMGRWFGYRINYADLCRLWLTEDAASWYAHITGAIVELRGEIKQMQQMGLTPKDFGLKVRAHPDSLIVTARNKMREAKDFEHSVSLSAAGLETTRLKLSAEVNSSNYNIAGRFIEDIKSMKAESPCNKKGWHFWRAVPKALVVSFLNGFESDLLNFDLNLPAISTFLEKTTEQKLQEWDVAIVSVAGARPAIDFAGLKVHRSGRFVARLPLFGALLISGSKRRVGSGEDEAAGLSEEQLKRISGAWEGKSPPGSAYRKERVRPLLLLYLIRGHTDKTDKKSREESEFRPGGQPLVAFSLSFPEFDDRDVAMRAVYKVNSVQWKSLFQSEDEEDDDEIDDVAVDDALV